MNTIGKSLTRHPKTILLVIFIITSVLFYYAFLSKDRLKIDFSLEQMFPDNDPDKEKYDSFRDKFSREDDSILLIYVPPTNPLTIESLVVIDSMVYQFKDIKNNSNCILLENFPCSNLDYKNINLEGKKPSAQFTDYDKDSRELSFRIYHSLNSNVNHQISISGLYKDSILTYNSREFLNLIDTDLYNEYSLTIPSSNEDFICFESVYEVDKKNKRKTIPIDKTPYYMIEGCNGDNEDQKINSLSNVRDINGDLIFTYDETLISNNQIYFEDNNKNRVFDCEPFDCGTDKVCPPNFYQYYDIILPDNYSYVEPDIDGSELDGWDEYYDNDFIDLNNNDIWDCEYYDISRHILNDFVNQHPFFNNVLLSSSGQVGGIYINLDDRINGQSERASFFKKFDQVISKNKNYYNWQWHDGGIPVLRTRYVELVHKERNTFIPLAFLVVTLILLFVFRNIKSIVLPLITMSITLVWISALMAFLGISINIVSYLTYNLLLIIGCSNAIHIQMKYHEGLFLQESKISSLLSVISKMGGALFLTSFTTAIGFFSLCLTNIRLTKEFGLILGIGVFIMFIMMIVVLPLLLLITKTPKKSMSERLIKGGSYKFVGWVNQIVNRYSKRIILCSILLFFIVMIGLFKIDYNISILDDLRPSNQLYKDIKSVEGNMGGVFPLEIMLEFDRDLLSKENLIKIDQFKNEVVSIDQITNINAITDFLSLYLAGAYSLFIEKNNPSLSFDPNVLPEDSELLKIFDTNSEFFKNLSGFLTEDYQYTRISARMKNIKADEANNIKNIINNMCKNIFGDNVKITITGSTFLALKTANHLVENLTTSFILAFIIIFISMIFLFKSFKLSLIAILPNIIPLMFAAAVMGFQDIKLRPTTAMTFAIALGIAVDDTIHFLARFRQEYAKNGSIRDAVANTLNITGKAIISTTLVLSLGFAVLYFSELMPNHEFGILATIILIIALIGSIFLLPALLIAINPKLKIDLKE